MGTFHEEAGKGSFKRPREVSKEQFESNWDKIFGKKKEQEKPFCTSCGNTGKVFDAGWEYECKVCK